MQYKKRLLAALLCVMMLLPVTALAATALLRSLPALITPRTEGLLLWRGK